MLLKNFNELTHQLAGIDVLQLDFMVVIDELSQVALELFAVGLIGDVSGIKKLGDA